MTLSLWSLPQVLQHTPYGDSSSTADAFLLYFGTTLITIFTFGGYVAIIVGAINVLNKIRKLHSTALIERQYTFMTSSRILYLLILAVSSLYFYVFNLQTNNLCSATFNCIMCVIGHCF